VQPRWGRRQGSSDSAEGVGRGDGEYWTGLLWLLAWIPIAGLLPATPATSARRELQPRMGRTYPARHHRGLARVWSRRGQIRHPRAGRQSGPSACSNGRQSRKSGFRQGQERSYADCRNSNLPSTRCVSGTGKERLGEDWAFVWPWDRGAMVAKGLHLFARHTCYRAGTPSTATYGSTCGHRIDRPIVWHL